MSGHFNLFDVAVLYIRAVRDRHDPITAVARFALCDEAEAKALIRKARRAGLIDDHGAKRGGR